MSREDAHKMLDRILDSGYCGDVLINCFKGNAGHFRLIDQVLKKLDDLILKTA